MQNDYYGVFLAQDWCSKLGLSSPYFANDLDRANNKAFEFTGKIFKWLSNEMEYQSIWSSCKNQDLLLPQVAVSFTDDGRIIVKMSQDHNDLRQVLGKY